MAWEIEHFKGKDFASNPENINRNWRPKKWVALCNDQLKAEGFEPVSSNDIQTNYMALLNVDEKRLLEMAQDKTQPMLVRIIIKNMLGGKGFDIVEKMIDRSHGKAVQKQETEITGTIVSSGYDLLQGIQSGKITRDEAYDAMRKAKGE